MIKMRAHQHTQILARYNATDPLFETSAIARERASHLVLRQKRLTWLRCSDAMHRHTVIAFARAIGSLVQPPVRYIPTS